MIPSTVVEDMARQCNIALWSADDMADATTSLVVVLHQFTRLIGSKTFLAATNLHWEALRPAARRGKTRPQMYTVMRALSGLGLRIRIERDPDPRSAILPIVRRARLAASYLAMRDIDPTGEQEKQARKKRLAQLKKKAFWQRQYRKRHAKRVAAADALRRAAAKVERKRRREEKQRACDEAVLRGREEYRQMLIRNREKPT